MKNALIFYLLIILSLTISSCISLDPPTVAYKDVQIKNLTIEETKIIFVLDVLNPNGIDLEADAYEYTLLIEDQELIKGKNPGFKLLANKKTEVLIPITFKFEKVFGSALKMAEYMLEGKSSIPYKFKGKFDVKAFNLVIPVPFESTGTIPLPDISPERLF